MCGAFGYEVLSLKRIRIMNVNINGIKEGEIRPLTMEETVRLRSLCGMGAVSYTHLSDFQGISKVHTQEW